MVNDKMRLQIFPKEMGIFIKLNDWVDVMFYLLSTRTIDYFRFF